MLDLRDRVRERTERFGLPEAVLNGCVRYLELLAAWNRRINLTALDLTSPVPVASLDKLIAEPFEAASWLPERCVWADIGSGGGSPAIPLKLLRSSAELHLVESRERKCAFLRAAIRELGLQDAVVHCARLEDLLASERLPLVDVITVRAVRLDPEMLSAMTKALRPGGRILVFGDEPPLHTGLRLISRHGAVVVLESMSH